jgi:type II secretory pathway component PulF
MARYEYRATDDQGVEVSNFIEASGVADAAAKVEALGLTILSITVASPEPILSGSATTGSLTTGAALATATRRLLGEHEAIVEPLRAYAQESARGRRQAELRQIADRLASGDEAAVLADISKAPVAWGTLLAATADPDSKQSLFQRFVDRERPVATLRRQRRIASFYPLAVATLCLLVLWPVASFVLPSFQDIFNDFGLDLPGLTLLVLAVGQFIRSGGVLVLTFAIGVGGLLLWALCRYFPELVSPLSNRLLTFWHGGALGMARLTTHTADLLEADLPAYDAVRLAGEHVYGSPDNQTADLATRLTSEPLRAAIARSPKKSFEYALAAPMESSSRIRLLRELSACHRERSAGAASWASGVAGPATIVTLGLLVGAVVLALYLPLIRLIEGLT